MTKLLSADFSRHAAVLRCLTVVISLTSCSRHASHSMRDQPPREPTSYPLPATDIPDSVRGSLDPSIAGFVGLTSEEGTKRLQQRWSTIDRPSLLSLRNTLGEFEVRSIVTGNGGMIYAARPNADDGVVGNSFYLPAPLPPDQLRVRLKSFGLADDDAVHDFLTYFAGLAEDTDTAGSFIYDVDWWPSFSDSWDGSIEGFDEWKGALMIYHARNGCHVLVRRDGKVAWWVMQEAVVEELAEDFDDFSEQFSEHRKLAWPFDPYGPP